MSETLVHVATRAVTWSETADKLKKDLDRWRWLVFLLSIAGALAAAIASQASGDEAAAAAHAMAHKIFAGAGTVLLAAGTFISSQFLRDPAVQAWVRARAASEALKREAFKYAARAKPYDDAPTADQKLVAEQTNIEGGMDDLADRTLTPTRPGGSPRDFIEPAEYRELRIRSAIEKFYRPKAIGYRKIASRLRAIELAFAFAATVITALAGVTGQTIPLGGIPFDLAALTAVLTTVSGAILAHIEASRYQHLVASYLATARRLEDADLGFTAATGGPNLWSDFVNRCEDIIAAENSSWIAKWTAPH
jgi:SMODS and SLOG-associating 2TM effector domain 1/Protein of unknown function (DUF4231)